MGKMIKDINGNMLADDEEIAPAKTGLKRYPFLFLVDISGSTGDQPDPDIHHINTSLANIMDLLRKPTPSSELAKQIDKVDLCIVSYSDDVHDVMPWKEAEKIPASFPLLVPMGGTSTAKAFEYALNRIADRLTFYKTKKLAFGMPHIIHFTDGAINDAKPGDAKWNAIKSRLSQVDGRTNSEKRIATMINFISPKGCSKDFVEVNGRKMSGIELLSELTGEQSIYEMGKEQTTFEGFVKLITVLITKITHNFRTQDAVDEAAKAIKDGKTKLRNVGNG